MNLHAQYQVKQVKLNQTAIQCYGAVWCSFTCPNPLRQIQIYKFKKKVILTGKTKRVIFCIQRTTTSSNTTITTSGGYIQKMTRFYEVKYDSFAKL